MSAIFNPLEIRTLRAAVNEIIPADDYPSGWDAGAGDFLEQLLTREPKFLPLYQAGLHGIDTAIREESGQELDLTEPDTRYGFMNRISQGKVGGYWEIDPEEFFSLLVNHVMEGFYADPGNGGNKGGVAWRMIGYEVTA